MPASTQHDSGASGNDWQRESTNNEADQNNVADLVNGLQLLTLDCTALQADKAWVYKP